MIGKFSESSTITKAADTTYKDYTNRERQSEKQIKSLKAENKDLLACNEQLAERLALLEKIDSILPEAPVWSFKPSSKKAANSGIPTLMLSDCHWDEVVQPNEVEGVNAYDREIAVQRLDRVLFGTILITRKFFSGLTYDGFHLMLGGDMLSGSIHEELEQTNEDTVLGSIDFWLDHLVGFVTALQKEFGRVHVSGVVGNHGRNTRKPRAKLRVRDNFDWFMYRQAARFLSGNSNITWTIPESADCLVKIYNTRFRLTHGDQFRGGSGIAGMLSPLMLGASRKSKRQMTLQNPHDWLVMGHWHSYWSGQGIIVNGSTKGYDEYAYVSNFGFERPQQALWITSPEHGIVLSAPIFADNRKKEKW